MPAAAFRNALNGKINTKQQPAPSAQDAGRPAHRESSRQADLQYDNSLFFFVSELMDLLLTGEDQSQADQPNNLAEGHPM